MGELWQVFCQFRLHKLLRGVELVARVVRHAEHGQRRGCFMHRLFADTGHFCVDRPGTLLLSQKHPVVKHIGLVRVQQQALRKMDFSLRKLLFTFEHPPEVVQGELHQWSGRFVPGAIADDPLPLCHGGIQLAAALQQEAEIEPGLSKCGRDGNRPAVGGFGARRITQGVEGGAQIEIDGVGVRRLVPGQPCLVQQGRKRQKPRALQTGGVID